ncbi:MAG: TonB-dependent receptor [Deltaproteobacteria bacterium]|nr:TonB-dependent receptor [Deltaproteobacteria bacterium]
MNGRRILIIFLLVFFVCLVVDAQVRRQTGVIRGIVTDSEGAPLPGVNVMATSPALMGTASDTTNMKGTFRLPALPPGIYTVRAEINGFKTVTREQVILRVGMTATVNFVLEPATVREEITVIATTPTIDVQSSKISNVLSEDIIQRIPLNRSLTTIVSMVPGANGDIKTYSGSIHGARPTTVNYEMDGVNTNSPVHNGPLGRPHYDAIEEVEIVTGGLPAQVGNTGGAFVNILTKSGGNEFHGRFQAYYTKDSMTNILYSDSELADFGMEKPESPIYDYDVSTAIGGPIIKNKVWFFTDLSHTENKNIGPFIPTTIFGKRYDQYNWYDSRWNGFFKMTTQLSDSMKFFVVFSGELINKTPSNAQWYRTEEATMQLKNNSVVSGTGNFTWIIGSDTFLDLRAGLVNQDYPITPSEKAGTGIRYKDTFTNYQWGAPWGNTSLIRRWSEQASARLTHFQDGFLGGDHEFGAGIEFQWGHSRKYWPTENPMQWYYYNGNPYWYRGFYNITTPHPTRGDGRLAFSNGRQGEKDIRSNFNTDRFGAYIQDSWTIQNRLSVNLGFRLDHYVGKIPGLEVKARNDLPFEIGAAYIEPELGFNPWGAYTVPEVGKVMEFTAISPRFGLTYDPSGEGKTALKVAISHYAEPVPLMYFSSASPINATFYQFDWWDLNNNGQPDSPGIDRYNPRSGLGAFKLPDIDFLKSRISSDLRAPTYIEFVASVTHELFRNFSVKAQYLYKRGKNEILWARWDPGTKKYWYSLDNAQQGWWVPFTTTVPAIDNFPSQTVTMYFLSNNSPWKTSYSVRTNVPEAKRNYHGVELSFDKRMSEGWALSGSIVLSQSKRFAPSDSPNDWINGYGRDSWDRPVAVKCFGVVTLPYRFLASFYFKYASGAPYARSVTVVPPAGWRNANNVRAQNFSVLLEPNGARRDQSIINLDFRLEKEFNISVGKLGIFVDVYNILGKKYAWKGVNPGGTWRPSDENTTDGKYIPDSKYGKVTSIDATRIFKFSIRYTF